MELVDLIAETGGVGVEDFDVASLKFCGFIMVEIRFETTIGGVEFALGRELGGRVGTSFVDCCTRGPWGRCISVPATGWPSYTPEH